MPSGVELSAIGNDEPKPCVKMWCASFTPRFTRKSATAVARSFESAMHDSSVPARAV